MTRRSLRLPKGLRDNSKNGGMEKGNHSSSKEWTFIGAFDCIVEAADDCQLSEDFFQSCREPLDWLKARLGFSDMQLVLLAILMEEGNAMTVKQMAEYLGVSRLKLFDNYSDLEELIKKQWIMKCLTHGYSNQTEAYKLLYGVVSSLRKGEVYKPMKIDGLSLQQLVDIITDRVQGNMNNPNALFSEDEEWMMRLVAANAELPLCMEVLSLNDIHEQSLLLLAVTDYAKFSARGEAGMLFGDISRIYPEEWDCNDMRMHLIDGDHVLMKKGLLEYKCEDGLADNSKYVLTKKAIDELLCGYKVRMVKMPSQNRPKNLKAHKDITAKELFFNAEEKKQLDRLAELFSQENLPSIQQRLQECGRRQGVACLFHGAPGTGKTESVLQLARLTGRDIFQVDIAGMRDKYVGESEKNIKQVFTQYRELCRNSEVMPILFFNEADALINKRTEHVEQSVDKMDNAMQNILLQEIEDLDGILIATTNLTANLDKAFERRFLFKVEFHNPCTEVKTRIWRSMLKDLKQDEAERLAAQFDFSGGQIENISRKKTIDYILTGRQPSVQELEDYCRAEQLGMKTERVVISGFGR